VGIKESLDLTPRVCTSAAAHRTARPTAHADAQEADQTRARRRRRDDGTQLIDKDLKTDASRATLSLPAAFAGILRAHRRDQLAARLAGTP
jgi:hypothetical protein